MRTPRKHVIFSAPNIEVTIVNPRNGNENTKEELRTFEIAAKRFHDGQMTEEQLIATMLEITDAEGHIGFIPRNG